MRLEPPNPSAFLHFVQDAQEAVDAEAPLAGPLGETGAVEDVLKLPHLSLPEDRVDGLPRDEFAVAEELSPGCGGLPPETQEAVLQGVAQARAGEALGMGEAGDVQAHPLADEIGRPFRHETVGHQLSAGDRDQPRHAVAAFVVDQGETAADAPVVVGLPRLHEGADAGVGAGEPLAPEGGDQLG